MRKIYFGALILFLIVAGLVIRGRNQKQITVPSPRSFEVQTNSEGQVTVRVEPLGVSDPIFEISFDTHSAELAQDLVQDSLLKDDRGGEYKPLAWEGDLPGGHHRKGLLKFGKISPAAQSLELIIQNVGGIDRSFNWKI